jgi:hypothetical protein
MNRITCAALAAGLSLFVADTSADERYSFGLGIGTMYAGLGANVAWLSDNNFSYLTVGCIGVVHDRDGPDDGACGAGIGWLRKNVFSSLSEKHGFGFHLGPVSTALGGTKVDAIYGVGATYAYFSNGVGQRGFVLGATPSLGRKHGDMKAYFSLNLGYQF